jgi:hypothetical protein
MRYAATGTGRRASVNAWRYAPPAPTGMVAAARVAATTTVSESIGALDAGIGRDGSQDQLVDADR